MGQRDDVSEGQALKEKEALREASIAYQRALADDFNVVLQDHVAENKPTWMGYEINKTPMDLWSMAEIIQEVKPGIIIECGTGASGSARFFASLLDTIGEGVVVTIEKKQSVTKSHPRVAWISGHCFLPKTVELVTGYVQAVLSARPDAPILVDLDASTDLEFVYRELQVWSPFVTEGSYLVVERTNVWSHESQAIIDGPLAAVVRFLGQNNNFTQDRSRERFLVSQNAGGYLRRTGGRVETSGTEEKS